MTDEHVVSRSVRAFAGVRIAERLAARGDRGLELS